MVDEPWRSLSRDDELRRRFDSHHARLLSGDPNAPDAICSLAASAIWPHLRRWFPREEPNVIEAAIDDALMKYLRQPERYDPRRGHPLTWLANITYHSILDARRWRQRRWSRGEFVGVDMARFPQVVAPDGPGAHDIWLQVSREELLKAAVSAEDRAFIVAKLDGVPDGALAKILGVGHLTDRAQVDAAKRRWKTILRRLERRSGKR